MKKFLLSLATVLMATTSVMAAEEICSVAFGSAGNVSSKGNSSYAGTVEYSGKADSDISGKTWTVVNFNNNNNGWTDMIKCGTKNNASVGSVATDFAFAEKITSVVISIGKFNETGKINSITLQTSDNATTWTTVATVAESDYDSTAKTLTINVPTPEANLYYKVNFDCAKCKGNGLVWLKGIQYYGESALVGDQKPADLSFGSIADYTVVLGGEAFVQPTLLNPNNLPVTYSSSDEAVATIDAQGKVEIIGKGKTIIKAVSEETEEFAAGQASYTITVVKVAKNIAELMEGIAENDKVVFGFETIVTYVNGQSCYLKDREGNATLLFGTTTYKVGDVLASNWEATYSPFNGLPEFKSVGTLPEVTGTEEVVYPEVETVTEADVNKVVILKDVTFAEATASGKTKTNFTGTTDAGEAITFRNNFADVPSVPAGKYMVTCAPATYNGNLQVYPISYAVSTGVAEIEIENGEAEYFNLQGARVANPENGLYIRVVNGKAQKVIVK